MIFCTSGTSTSSRNGGDGGCLQQQA